MRPSAPRAHEPTLPVSAQVAPTASCSPRRDLPCTQRSCQSGLRGAELREQFAVPLGLVFHRGLGSSRWYRRSGSKAPGSPRARSRCRRSSTSRTRGGRAAGPRGGAASGKRGKTWPWRIPVGRNRLPGQCLLQACEGSPALVTTGAMAPQQVGCCSTQQEQLHCQQSALRPALAVSSPKPSSRSPFPWFQNSPAAPSRFFVFFF